MDDYKHIQEMLYGPDSKPAPVPSPLIGVDTPSEEPWDIHKLRLEIEARKRECQTVTRERDRLRAEVERKEAMLKIAERCIEERDEARAQLAEERADGGDDLTVYQAIEDKYAEERAKNEPPILDSAVNIETIRCPKCSGLINTPIRLSPDATVLREALEEIMDKLKEYPGVGRETCPCGMCACLRIARAALPRSSPAAGGGSEMRAQPWAIFSRRDHFIALGPPDAE